MKENTVEELLNKLKNGEVTEIFIEKDVFLEFRKILMGRSDFKHFRGIAGRSGSVIYQYVTVARS